ncbi:pentatricopeptide repeat-containing protein At3g04750, mitochondrial [Cornus florida]|uniref:pentatricopeptide repeat-containing protein At3g04750, mitochondrial n=1 Tax=Cornus florida TaxID=4283 RepID=UPI00289B7C01|nr:pentatricopeptide repeat-containing protein At3g04750, mitochondrial [Cornus florida]XP_059652781.1 pentatricopeptide repeat-containing protein At3g04750, mitochondrial [Cornus florida]XP_059652782.1 pentatricopeptide repeat-containing protein At3g04750, mitochondrial [Cornus florida]
MHRYGRGVRFLTSASNIQNSNWDPRVSLSLNHPTLVSLENCTSRDHFRQILAQMMKNNLTGQTFPMSRLILFSAKTHPENLDMAISLFNHFTPHPNLYIYNTMISASSFSSIQSFALYKSMLESCVYPDGHTLISLLQASKCLLEVKQIHCHAIVIGLLSFGYLQNSFIKLYLENGQLGLAHQVFRKMPSPDAVSYNIVIVEYAKKGYSLEALEYFCEMVGSGFEPDEYTMIGLLVSCGNLGDALLGKSVHAWLERRKLMKSWNLILGNALLDMYVKCKEMDLARRLFDAFVERDVVSGNTIISGYAKVAEMKHAHAIFDAMPCRDLLSWNSLIAGYTLKGDYMMVRKLFSSMMAEKVQPNGVTMVNLVSGAAEIGALDQGRQLHGLVVRLQMKIDAFLGSALIDMYCKCGNIEKALMVFRVVTEKDVTLWTTMITGLAFHGHGSKALDLFSEMQKYAIPNHVTFVAVLTACSHRGLVDQGLRIFKSMTENYGIEPGVEHYGCLVDLLARSGRLAEAKSVIDKMPMQPSRSIWGAVLSACKAHGNVEIAEIALRELLKLEPEKEGGYVLLSNIYAAVGRWKYSDKIREIMEDRGVKKTAGWSSVVVGGIKHVFVATDKRNARWVEIQSILLCLKTEMKLGHEILLDSLQSPLLD